MNRMPPRDCLVCGAPYNKSGAAKTCGASKCRAENKRRSHARWRAAPENREALRARSAKFFDAHPEYMREWRAKNA